jgi:3-deoxy-7-phosphoheptulonate synthase
MKDITERDRHTNLRLAVRQYEGHRTKVRVGSAEFGGDQPVIIAGPCAVESREQVMAIAEAVKRAGASMLRGGAFKPLTFPYRNERVFELRERGLEYLREAGRHADLPVVSEVVDVRLVETVARHVDMIQIGSRNMQNFPLLEEAARAGKPVLLKRHYGSSLRDWLGAAEYLLYHGNPNVVLCERGVAAPHTHQPASRFIVDLQVVPAVRDYSHLPVIVDPSHATFRREYVAPIARAALAVGADGVMVDVHPVPEEAAVDPLQALNYEAFGRLVEELRAIASAMAHASPVGHS